MNESNKIEVRGSLVLKDLTKIYYGVSKKQISKLFFCGIILLIFLASNFTQSWLVIIIVFVLICLLYAVSFKNRVRMVWNSTKLLQKEIRYTLAGDTLEIEAGGYFERNKLNNFYKLEELRDYLLLYNNAFSFLIFPKRFFSSNSEYDLFKNCLEKYLGIVNSSDKNVWKYRTRIILAFVIIAVFFLITALVSTH